MAGGCTAATDACGWRDDVGCRLSVTSVLGGGPPAMRADTMARMTAVLPVPGGPCITKAHVYIPQQSQIKVGMTRAAEEMGVLLAGYWPWLHEGCDQLQVPCACLGPCMCGTL